MHLLAKSVFALSLSAITASSVHDTGSTLFDYVVIAGIISGALIYVVLQVRDYRPNKRLREDLLDARNVADGLGDDLDAAKQRVSQLERSRDFDSAFQASLQAITEARQHTTEEHGAMLAAFEEHGRVEAEVWAKISEQLTELTAALINELGRRPTRTPNHPQGGK